MQHVCGRNSGAFSNESGASLSKKKDFFLFTQNSCSCWHLPFAAFQFPFTGALTNARAHTHIFPFAFLPVSALQTFHWMLYRVAGNTKHVEEARGACHSSLIRLNATWQRFTSEARGNLLVLPAVNRLWVPFSEKYKSCLFRLCSFHPLFSFGLDSILLDTSYIPDQKRWRKKDKKRQK